MAIRICGDLVGPSGITSLVLFLVICGWGGVFVIHSDEVSWQAHPNQKWSPTQ